MHKLATNAYCHPIFLEGIASAILDLLYKVFAVRPVT